jgi:hypothetical protein
MQLKAIGEARSNNSAAHRPHKVGWLRAGGYWRRVSGAVSLTPAKRNEGLVGEMRSPQSLVVGCSIFLASQSASSVLLNIAKIG